MKKVWENPELNGLELSETKQSDWEVRYSATTTLDMDAKVQYLCLGVYQVGTDIKISDCPNPGPYPSYAAWAAHAGVDHAGLSIGEKVEITPIS